MCPAVLAELEHMLETLAVDLWTHQVVIVRSMLTGVRPAATNPSSSSHDVDGSEPVM
jgi:hypothetical protein